MIKTIFRVAMAALFLLANTPYVGAQGPVPPNRVRGEIFMEHNFGFTTGAIFFVDDSGSDSVNGGRDPAEPFASLDYAVGRCAISPAAASTGCTIYLMPGHAETLTAANAVDIDVAGVSVIGLGTGNLRPTFTMATNAAAEINVDAANFYLANIIIVDNIACTACIELTANADGFHADNILIREGTQQPAIMIDMVGQADDVLIENSVFLVPTADTGATGIDLSALTPARFTFRHNVVRGDFNQAAIFGSGAITDAYIHDNIFENALAGQYAAEFSAASLGVFSNNYLISSTAITVLDPGSLNVFGNKWSNGIDNEAAPIPESQLFIPGFGYRVESLGTSLAADENVFTITGLVAITLWVVHITTVFSGATTNLGFDTDGGVVIMADTVVDDFVDEGIMLIHGDQTLGVNMALAPEIEVGHFPDDKPFSWLIIGGATAASTVIVSDSGAADTGVYDSYIYYIPLTIGATIVAS